jgi:hypothetical protein
MIMKKSLTMALTVVVASAMLFVVSCNKSDNPLVDTTTGALTATPPSVSLLVGGTASVTISGGKVPYSVNSNSDSTKVRATLSGTTLSVTGLAVGSATIVVKDSAGTSTVSVPVTVASMIATPNSVTVVKGSTATVTISGGTTPYTILTSPNSLVATASISSATLSITGVNADTTSVTVKDNSSPAKTVTVKITVTATAAALTANPTSVTVVKGSTATVTISGGTTPYTIQTAPTSTVATATISGATLSVTGVAAGSTSVTVKDNSSPANTVTVAITVTTSGGGFTTAGSMSFTSNQGNFSANGIYNPSATTGTGAGAILQSSGGSNFLTVYGFRVNSATSFDIALVQFMDSSPIATGSFVYPPTTGSKLVMISYFPAMNPSDTTTESFYLLSTATANISAITSSNAQGTFSGSGMFYVNSTPNPSQTINITGGTFNVPVIPGGANTVNNKIEGIVKRIVSQQRR